MLPKIEYPITELTLPSTGEKLLFRPFTVKEEKILLIANESEEMSDKLRAVRQIVNNCCQSKIDVMSMPSFDLEYLFLKIRGFSVDNIIELNYTDPDDDSKQTFYIDINEIEITKTEGHTNIIDAGGGFNIRLKYPTIEDYLKFSSNPSEDGTIDLIVSCIDCLYDEEKYWKKEEYTEKEWKEHVEKFPSKTLKEITNFFYTIPVLKTSIKFKNMSGQEKEIVLKGISDFLL